MVIDEEEDMVEWLEWSMFMSVVYVYCPDWNVCKTHQSDRLLVNPRTARIVRWWWLTT